MTAREIGRVAALYRYPVKSMAAERLDAVEVSWSGLVGDRRWAFVRGGTERMGFPWLTIREQPGMWMFHPRFIEPDKPDSSMVMVRAPSGVEMEVADPELADLLGHGSRVLKQNRGNFDAFPLSIITTQTVEALGGMVGERLDARRFRPNIVIDSEGVVPFEEDEWVGSVVRIGALRARIDKRDKRCVLVNVDPETTEKNHAVLRAIARERDARLGVYGTTVHPGWVSVGDTVSEEP